MGSQAYGQLPLFPETGTEVEEIQTPYDESSDPYRVHAFCMAYRRARASRTVCRVPRNVRDSLV